MTDNKYDLEDLISTALDQKPTEFSDVFNDLMLSRVHNAINDKKMEIAAKVFGWEDAAAEADDQSEEESEETPEPSTEEGDEESTEEE